jgi:hypothetical protein
MNKFIKLILIIIIGSFLALGANNLFAIPEDYVSSTKIVEKINHQKQNIYFQFENDSVNYSFTEFGDVTSEYILENINVGDELIITTENNVGDFKYTLIQEVEKNGNIIFSSVEYYQNHNRNLKLIFIPSIIVITLFFSMISFIKFGTNNVIDNFTIRQPQLIFNFFVFSTLVGFVIPLMFSIIYFAGKMPYQTYMFSYIFYIFLILGFIGLLSFSREKLVYDGENYYVYSMFKKVKIINKSDIKSIVIDNVNKGRKHKSGVYNKSDERIFLFSFGLLCCLKNELFINSLILNGVNFIELELNNKGEIKEKEIKLW